MVIVGLIARVSSRHVVSGQSRKMTSRAVHAVTVVRVVARVVMMRRGSSIALSLDLSNLSGRLGQHGNVTTTVVVNGGVGESKSRIRVGRRNIGRGQGRSGSRADRLGRGRRRHHALRVHVRREALVLLLLVLMLVLLMLLGLVSSPGVGVVVNARVTGEFVRARKLLAATGELAGMRLLARVSADVTSLVLKAVESLIAKRALVGSGQLVRALRGLGAGKGPIGFDNGDSCGSHVDVALLGAIGISVWR